MILCPHICFFFILQNQLESDSSETLVDRQKISYQLPQFIILPNIFSYPPSTESNVNERDWSNFVQENFILDSFSVDWNSLINNHNKDVDHSFNNFFKEKPCYFR